MEKTGFKLFMENGGTMERKIIWGTETYIKEWLNQIVF